MTIHDELIIACTLDTDLVRERVDDWGALVAESTAVEDVDGGVSLRFPRRGADAAQIAALAAAERDCCPFFTFVLQIDDGGSRLDITAPAAARALVDVLLGLETSDSGS